MATPGKTQGRGLTIQRRFTEAGADPGDRVAWERRTARITNDQGEPIFEQIRVKVPKTWSQTATNVVASKYFRGHLDTPERESSVRELIDRVAGTIAGWGTADGYFATAEDSRAFRAELTHLILHQMAAFNSPVWFNVGLSEKPQCSACFINSVRDEMDSILGLAHVEARLFKWGSGAGSNLSPLRAAEEPLSGGGTASGPVSFMRGFDAFAGVLSEGGKTRPPAKIAFLDADHPDILEFVRCKAAEQRKAWSLIEAGFDGAPGGEAFRAVSLQHTNTSVRLPAGFMRAVKEEQSWKTTARRSGQPMGTFKAHDLLHEIAQAAHECGEPGVQFVSTVNAWHTCPASGQINASTPCSEFMFLDDTACNLASLNLLAFVDDGMELDVDAFRHAVDLMVTAQDIIIDRAGYPTERIEENSHIFRPLGLGFANLGALLMARALPYDSDRGRAYAAAVTALMTGEAFAHSGLLAERFGPFPEYRKNHEPFGAVLDRHMAALDLLDSDAVPSALREAALTAWSDARDRASKRGVRNAQVTALAPTGTIGLMMDCDTMGVEPDLALVKYRQLVGGGTMKVVNGTVPLALEALDYESSQIKHIVNHVEEQGTIEGAPGLRQKHLSVFDCARQAQAGRRSISPEGHLRMMAALQPFLSGAVSKTVNLPRDATVDDVEGIFIEAQRLGLKAISIHREGSTQAPPPEQTKAIQPTDEYQPRRLRLPDERMGVTHKFSIGGHKGYLTVGLYDDGTPGEIFVRMAKAGSVVAGLMDAFALAVSLSLQYGVPLEVLVEKYAHSRFEPSGFTSNPQIPIAKSIMDYIFRWLGMKFLDDDEEPPDEEPTFEEQLTEEEPDLLPE